MQSGMILEIKAGTYSERVTLTAIAGIGSDAVTIRGDGGDVIVDGTGVTVPADFGGLFEITDSDNITLRGITFRNVTGA